MQLNRTLVALALLLSLQSCDVWNTAWMGGPRPHLMALVGDSPDHKDAWKSLTREQSSTSYLYLGDVPTGMVRASIDGRDVEVLLISSVIDDVINAGHRGWREKGMVAIIDR